jgi:fibronectin-binding autotransporter adhesin
MVELGGHLATNAGVAICGAAVAVFPTSVNATQTTQTAGNATATTTTSSGGDWSFSCLAANTYDVRITCGSSVRWRRYIEEVQITTGTLANLDVDGTVDADVTDFNVLSSGDIDLVSSANTAAAVYIAQSTGTSATIKIHADTGTSVTEGAESINILSDVGGIGLRSTANLANAINLTVDGGTTSSMTLFNDQGTGNTEGSASIQLLSDAGGINIKSTADLAGSVRLTADGGTSETIILHADQGTSVTEGAESISLLSDAGGVGIRSTANLANAVNITADGGTTSTIQIYNDQGTAVNEGVASIQLLSDVGGIGIKSGLNAAGAIRLTADAGTSETIVLHADQGNGVGSICLTSDVGGITLNPATFVTIGGNATNAGEMRILEDTDNGSNYVALKAPNVSTSYTITLPTAVAGTCGFVLKSTTAGVTSWAAAAGGIASVAADTTPQVGGSAGFDLQAQLLVGNGGTTGIAVSANGEVTMAAQPAFLAFNSSTDSDVSGDATLATADFDTEIFDQNADFASDTFTAPVTGRYLLIAHVAVGGMTVSMGTNIIAIATSNRNYNGNVNVASAGVSGFTFEKMNVVDMDAADTATVTLDLTGGNKEADIIGEATNLRTVFSGHLVA